MICQEVFAKSNEFHDKIAEIISILLTFLVRSAIIMLALLHY
jgi:hypothetical protein